jgi:hypothetical protein
MPNLSAELITELADLSDENKLMVRDPKIFPGQIDANDEAAPRVREIVTQYSSEN